MNGRANYLKAMIEEHVGEGIIPAAVKAAGVDPKRFSAACDRVYCDGMYGPISERDWREQDGRKPYGVGAARAIVRKVFDEIRDVPIMDYEFCDATGRDDRNGTDFNCGERPCPGHDFEAGRIEKKEVLAAYFGWVRDIYGHFDI